ncbi:biotin/lipoate A/B protein ligase family protein [Chloroflexota bacterium]
MVTAPSTWRLLRTQPARGSWNMAVDEAILEFAARGEVPPTLRLYAWEPPCISLGYAQPIKDVDLDRLQEFSWEIVRRPTGGRAILHTDELTYSVCGPNSDPRLVGGVLESYQHLSFALLEALSLMGITADPVSNSASQQTLHGDNPVCFEVPSNYEITVNSMKLIGSAQARRKSGVLQHGSLPLSGDLTRILKVLDFPDENRRQQAARRLLVHGTTVEDVLGFRGDWWLACQAFQIAFNKTLNLNLQYGGLSPSEGRRAMELYREKYNNPEWTERF